MSGYTYIGIVILLDIHTNLTYGIGNIVLIILHDATLFFFSNIDANYKIHNTKFTNIFLTESNNL